MSATTARMNCAVSRRVVLYVARSVRFALCTASVRARMTDIASSSIEGSYAPTLVGSGNTAP